MKMPREIDHTLFAPCGMNCLVCYKYSRHKKPCGGCFGKADRKPEHCRKCRIKECAGDKGVKYCYACQEYPCRRIRSLERSYNTRYHTSLTANSQMVKAQGIKKFMERQAEQYTCPRCGGVISIHDAECSECRFKVTVS
ncbi:DUF3795 domain-containing protein [Lacrimispora sp. NSJ-141]|uniref:DUF3795 domain-containing protein n=1 Tax=Lientehia hominis TaxID=2897778 RepID=A0AAP2RK02_9FIRM|nr:DUF3795 domain-containing protein [Lientehia hominis]MCD2493637.1 DUF3795 domain-containing protein [Lientehia hominis]